MNPDQLQLPGDLYKVRKRIFIAAPRERVFEALSGAEHWNRFFTTGMELDPRPGGVCNFRWQNWGPDLTNLDSPGRVLEIDPPQLLVFRWGRPGLETTARLGLEPAYGGTVLSLIEDGYPQTRAGFRSIMECSAHWGELLALIKFYVEYGITYRSPEAPLTGRKSSTGMSHSYHLPGATG